MLGYLYIYKWVFYNCFATPFVNIDVLLVLMYYIDIHRWRLFYFYILFNFMNIFYSFYDILMDYFIFYLKNKQTIILFFCFFIYSLFLVKKSIYF